MKAKNTAPAPVTLRELPAVGRYRIRVIRKGAGDPYVDVREYVNAQGFEGFTRRGITLSLGQLDLLRVALKEAQEHITATCS